MKFNFYLWPYFSLGFEWLSLLSSSSTTATNLYITWKISIFQVQWHSKIGSCKCFNGDLEFQFVLRAPERKNLKRNFSPHTILQQCHTIRFLWVAPLWPVPGSQRASERTVIKVQDALTQRQLLIYNFIIQLSSKSWLMLIGVGGFSTHDLMMRGENGGNVGQCGTRNVLGCSHEKPSLPKWPYVLVFWYIGCLKLSSLKRKIYKLPLYSTIQFSSGKKEKFKCFYFISSIYIWCFQFI